jgi:hypothetical protein
MTGLYSLFCGNKTCRIIRAVDEWSIRGSRGEQNRYLGSHDGAEVAFPFSASHSSKLDSKY